MTTIHAATPTVSAGESHTAALKSDGTVWAWGANFQGRLGNNSSVDSLVPVQTSGLSGVVAVSAGSFHTAALKSDGTVWAWGSNIFGKLGNGSTVSSSPVPVQTSGLSGVVAVSAGAFHTAALKSDGTVWAWGANFQGQLGNNSMVDSLVPVQVSGLSGVVAVSAGGTAGASHTTALKSDGTVWAWGANFQGQLGNNSKVDSLVPVQVSGLSGVVAVSAGGLHTAALKSDGTVWAWGLNRSGQLGDNSRSESLVPVQVVGPDGQGFLNLGQTLVPVLLSIPTPPLPSATPPLSLFPPLDMFGQSLYDFTQTSTAQFSPEVAQNLQRLGADVKPLIDPFSTRWLKRTASIASEDIAQSAKFLSGISNLAGIVTGGLVEKASAILSLSVDFTILSSWIEADPVARSINGISNGLLVTAGCWDAAAKSGLLLQIGATACLADWTSILMQNELAPALRKYAIDPPDPDFTTVIQARVIYVPDVAKTGNTVIDNYVRQTLDATSRASAYLSAVNRTFDKYAGAYNANSPDYAALQMQAFLVYLRLYDEAMREVQTNLNSVMAGLSPTQLAALKYDPAATVALQERLQTTGFTDREIRFLTGIGFQSADLETIRSRLIAFDARSMKGDLLGAVRQLQSGVAQASTAGSSGIPLLGDIDVDGDVDTNDLAKITSALNQPASGSNDLRDLDGDGKITALDSRKLVTLCTRPRCATR